MKKMQNNNEKDKGSKDLLQSLPSMDEHGLSFGETLPKERCVL
jgi:hypothetical protein